MIGLFPPLPLADPGEPDIRSAGRYLLWTMRRQWRSIVTGGLFGTVWMVGIAALPGAIGAGVDQGVTARDPAAAAMWAGIVVALAALIALAGLARHQVAVYNFLNSAYRTIQLATRHATRVGAILPRRIATGEVVSVGGSDPSAIGTIMDVLGRATGSVVSFVAVAVVLLVISPGLGVVILVGLPLQALAMGPLLKPLQQREHDYRHEQGLLTSRANDIVAGLRVLRGIGGEDLFAQRYAEQSHRVKNRGVRVAATSAVMKGLQTLLPGALLAAVTWLGARQASAGTITPGELVSVFGYTTFLIMPMNTFLEVARKYTAAHAAARRVTTLLSVEPGVADTGTRRPDRIGELHDPESGLSIPPGRFTALVCASPTDATVLSHRLARYTDSTVTADGVPLSDIDLVTLRGLIMLCDNDDHFFAGRLRDQLDPAGTADDATVSAAIGVAVAGDAVDSLGGLDGRLEAAGRNVSGGQRQRLRLARAVIAAPPVLVLVEPTSAVDAHTESLIAARLAAVRAGSTTVVTTTSPLMLDHADRVALIVDGAVVATGTHRHLLAEEPRYRAVVTRRAGETTPAVPAARPGEEVTV